jgi:hypothetical protein
MSSARESEIVIECEEGGGGGNKTKQKTKCLRSSVTIFQGISPLTHTLTMRRKVAFEKYDKKKREMGSR